MLFRSIRKQVLHDRFWVTVSKLLCSRVMIQSMVWLADSVDGVCDRFQDMRAKITNTIRLVCRFSFMLPVTNVSTEAYKCHVELEL